MKRQRPSLTSLVALFLLIFAPVLYVLSYAPVVRMYGGGSYPEDRFLGPGDLPIVADGSQLRLFWPVDWLIDETPLHDPLFAWADMWGVRTEFELGESIRQIADLDYELPESGFHYVETHATLQSQTLEIDVPAESPEQPECGRTNQQIAEELASLLRQSRVRGQDIEVRYKDGRATLIGVMASAADRRTAVRIAQEHTSVATVEDQLEVRRWNCPAESP